MGAEAAPKCSGGGGTARRHLFAGQHGGHAFHPVAADGRRPARGGRVADAAGDGGCRRSPAAAAGLERTGGRSCRWAGRRCIACPSYNRYEAAARPSCRLPQQREQCDDLRLLWTCRAENTAAIVQHEHCPDVGSGSAVLLSQVRPVMGKDDGDTATHSWSIGAYGGQHTLHLDAISDGTTRLVSCPTADSPAESDAGDSGCCYPPLRS